MQKQRCELILIPSPGAGHLVSFLRLASRLVERDDRFTITILLIRLPFDDPTKSTAETSSTTSSIRYITLPDVEPPPIQVLMDNWEKYNSDLIASHLPNVRDVITTSLIKSTPAAPLAGVVVDLFCTPFIDLANELGVPSYVFYTSSAAFLGYNLHMPSHFDRWGRGIRESDPDSLIPTYKNPYPSNLTPPFILQEAGYMAFLTHARRITAARGVLINTFSELEPYALGSLLDAGGLPRVYTVGPILDLLGQAHGRLHPDNHARIMEWLDRQPCSSVLFLCFGSVGSMLGPQMREVASGLYRSGVRFLWAVRKPPPGAGRPEEYKEKELKEVLPPEFMALLEEGKGLVCGWAPQTEVLAHEAIGGFISHCGWNSILESLWFGRPIATWPMYAEQRPNAFQLVKEMELAVELRLDYDKEDSSKFVGADEIERAIRRLMDEGNSGIRKKTREIAEQSRRAVMEGGSSFISLRCFIEDVLGI